MRDQCFDTIEGKAPHRRRALIVTGTLANGGMERQLTLLAKALAARDWAVRVVSFSNGMYATVLREAGVDLDILPRGFRFDFRPAVRLSEIIRDWRPDFVHAFDYSLNSFLPCRIAGVPVVDGTIRQAGVHTDGRGLLRRAMISAADAVIANSQAGLDAYRVDPRWGRAVYNAFDPERWRLCTGVHRTEGPTTVVMAARMHRHKDYRCLLDAARVLSAEDPSSWRFLAVGSGPERPALLTEYCDLLASGAATFPDGGTEVLGLVNRAHIGVLLTNPAFAAEGLSNSIMEYMACGLPVVCSDSGGNRELVVEGETGFVVPSSDVGAVVARLRALRDDPAMAARMGRAGRERIATEFTVDALVSGTVAAYELAAQRRRTGARTP